MSQVSTATESVQICLRRFAPDAAQQRQQDVLARLHDLSERGTIGDVTEEWWSTRVCTPGAETGAGASCPAIVGELLDAVDGTDISLQPAFRQATGHESTDSDVLYLPVICLVVRQNGEITGIYPACDGDEHYSVKDGIEQILAGEPLGTDPR